MIKLYTTTITLIFLLLASLISTAQVPVNDDPCGAVVLPLSADNTCSNQLTGTTVGATTTTGVGYVNPVECGIASQPKDVWYKVTTLASGAGSNKLHFKLSAPAGGAMATANMTLFKPNGSCPSISMSLISGACRNSSSTSFTSIEMTVQYLTPNTTYYLRVSPVNNTSATGTFDICAYLPVNTPQCVQYISPAPNAANVPVNQFVAFESHTAPGAILYELYLDPTHPRTPLVKSGTATKDSTKFLIYNQKYYWYIAPRNSTGAATGCAIDSFTTASAPANCIPLTTNNCSSNDTLKLFTLKGENNTAINNPSGCSPGGFADYSSSTDVILAQGKAYGGLLHASFVHDYFTIWIDYNNDGYYTDNERVLNNLRQQWSGLPTPYTINIPVNATAGIQKMKIRKLYYSVNPAVVARKTDPCNNYTYSETEEYRVTIIPDTTTVHQRVAPAANNNCMKAGGLTVDEPTNNNTQWIHVVDGSNNLVAALHANGNELGEVQVSVYKNDGSIRTLANGTKILDRNITITPQFQPVTPVTLRLYLTDAEMAALQNADPTIAGRSSLQVTKTGDTCMTSGAMTAGGTTVPQQANGAVATDHYIDVSVSSVSTFYIHGGNTALPVSIMSFTGTSNGSKNQLLWTTPSDANHNGFDTHRSSDGKNFTLIVYITHKVVL